MLDALKGGGDYQIVAIGGEQGSAKTTLAKVAVVRSFADVLKPGGFDLRNPAHAAQFEQWLATTDPAAIAAGLKNNLTPK